MPDALHYRPHIFPYIDLNLSTMGVPPQQPQPVPSAQLGSTAPPAAASAKLPLGPISTNAQPAPALQAPSTSGVGGPKAVVQTTISQPAVASPPPSVPTSVNNPVASHPAAPSVGPPAKLAPSSDAFGIRAPDDVTARNTLATIFKRIAEKDTQVTRVASG